MTNYTMFEPRGRVLALVAYNRILENPESWDQETWRCGSTCCFAGHVALAAGYRWYGNDSSFPLVVGPHSFREKHVLTVARNLLQVSHEVAMRNLFDPDLTLDEIRDAIDEYLPEEEA